MCENAPETKDVVMEKDTCIRFFTKLGCLGSEIYFIIDDSEDVKNSVRKGSKYMGALKFIWDNCDVPILKKINYSLQFN